MKAPRPALTVILIIALLAAPLAAGAQAGKVYRIGFLSGGGRLPQPLMYEQALRERGWVTGENLVVDYRGGAYDQLPVLAVELVRLKPDVIVAVPTAAVRAAKAATSTIPIVMFGVSDPVGEGLIASFARPGGNVTGLTITPTLEIYAKQLQLLREAVPGARRIAFLWNPANPAAASAVRAVEEAAGSLGVELQVVGARTPEEFEPAFRAVIQARAQALLILIDPLFRAHRAQLADLSVRDRLPTLSSLDEYAKAGGLLWYGTSAIERSRRIADYVDRILKGAKPADLPIEQPTKFELVINLKTAKTLGLTIPPSVLARADEIIK